MLRGLIPTPKDPFGEARISFPGYLEGFGQPQVGRKLEQFSMQLTSTLSWTDADLHTHLDLASLPNAIKMIKFFGANMFGKVVDYKGKCGYDPERIREIGRSNCCPLDFDEPPSEIFRAHNMGEYGSGGLPEFLRPYLVAERSESATAIDRISRQYARAEFIRNTVKRFRAHKARSVRFGDLAWCKAARSIQACWRVSTTLDSDWGVWLLKVAVHAACTLERAKSKALESSLATITLFQLSREIGTGLQSMLSHACVSTAMAAVAALLMEVGLGFISAGLCLIFIQEQDAVYTQLLFGLSEACACMLTSAGRIVSKLTPWKELAIDCIKKTNFCPSRQIKTVMELHSREMFHLVARYKHITTSRTLHKGCGTSCLKARSKKNHQCPGHLNEGCGCSEKYFKPIETSKLVLFDIVEQKLFEPKSKTPYVAVSQIWFQGIFGQESRRCGECSLNFLATACSSIGVRHVWIDTLCMPKKSQKLRDEVVTQLRDIYLRADATLVVDAGLISTVAKTVLDLSLAILLSDWSSRIWTLQEGVLASKLLFCVGDQVLALPQANGPGWLLDIRNMVPSKVLQAYGMREGGLDQPLSALLCLAAGRQTSHECDYLYGLSALLPSPPKREKDLELVAMEVARMYKLVDLGMLQAPLLRCRTEGYRWMPLAAEKMFRAFDTGILGFISPEGLMCNVTAFIKLTSVADSHTRGSAERTAEVDMPIKHWYSTKTRGVFVGTFVEASHLIFCLTDYGPEATSYGFVVSPTTHDSRVQYMGWAAAVGKIPITPKLILVT
ncbi:hypothetical protein BGZ51_005689 [Haplosporangium sp. Z 767]|nr:hypothetical protein BGZ50_006374 [Haplosporangium sp. Z 11]KAF9181062.1 hypothetical protein BGZ51_005689 [Haplosporangium sp. Z 767]